MRKPRPKPHAQERQITLLDEAMECRQNLVTLSELLQNYADTEGLHPDVLAHAGKMIGVETQKLYALFQTLSPKGN